MASSAPFTEDALNRFRITHSDRDLRPLLRRIHRFSHLRNKHDAGDQGDAGQAVDVDVEVEREMINLELIKWRIGIERVIASVGNLERQKAVYQRRADETVERTERLRQTLAEEKLDLEAKRRLRDHEIKCDEVAKRISARGKIRVELDEQITTLESSLEEQRASHAIYLQTLQSRLETFAQITRLIEDCRNTKLPVEANFPSSAPEEDVLVGEKMDVDSSAASSGSGVKLSATAQPFQPTTSPSATNNNQHAARASAPPSSSLKPPSGNYALPSRPSASRNPPSGPSRSTSTSTSLPARPSALRSSTTPALPQGTSSLEDGEVGEEGEVSERANGTKRTRERETEAASRSTRSRAK